MPEEQGGGGAPEAPSGNGPAPAAQIPDGYVPKSEIEALEQQLERHRQRETSFQGWKPFYEGAQKVGIKDPGEFEHLGALLQQKPKGMSTAAYARMIQAQFGGEEPQEQEGGSGVDPEAIKNELRAEMRKELATSEHKRLMESAQSGFKESLGKLMGEFGIKPGSFQAKQFQAFADGQFHRAMGMFDDDHPLHGSHLRPPDEKGMAGVIDAIRKELESAKGAEIDEAATEAAKPKPKATPPTAGQGPGQAGPDQKTGARGERVGLTNVERSQAEEFLRKKEAARKQGAMSSA